MEEFGGWSYGLFWHRWKKSGDYKMIVLVRKMMFGYKVMMSEDAMYDDGVVMEAVVEKFVKYFKSIFYHNNWYFASFIFCE